MRGRLLCSLALFSLLSARLVSAQPPPITPQQVVAPPGAGQRALSMGVVRAPTGVEIVAQTCATQTCSLAGARALPVQPPWDRTSSGIAFHVLAVGSGRHVVHIEAGSGANKWQAIVAAPLAGKNDPIVLWSGITPEHPPVGVTVDAVQVTPSHQAGTVQVLVGQRSSRFELCGRATLLTPQVVHAADLSLRHVKLQRLSASERATAEQVTAVPFEWKPPLGKLLAAEGASSAHGAPGALTDGDAESSWSERRGKEGRGEFVIMRAPAEVPITSVSFTVRPPTTVVEDGAAPKSFFIAADGRLIRVTIPEDAWKKPGASYRVELAQPLSTSCLGIVLDDAYAPPAAKDMRVTFSEVTAYTGFDQGSTHDSLAESLSEATDAASAAAEVLLRGGPPAFEAVARKVPGMNESGRRRAMQVLDAAPCSIASPVFAALLASPDETERKHAADRIRRCGRRSADALVQVIEHGAGCAPSHRNDALCATTRAQQKRNRMDAGRLAAADELASISPERAVPVLAPKLGQSNRPTRRALRQFLSRAAGKEAGREALARQLADASLPAPATIDLLRSVKESVNDLRVPAGSAFARLVSGSPDLRTRYLLLEPAAKLAAAGDGRGLAFLTDRIARDPEPMVRTQAVTVAAAVQGARPWVIRSLEDENVRVRHAATTGLAGQGDATPYLVRRLVVDDWPMVRASAARSLATAGPSPLADRALAGALVDDSPKVRQWAATALGARGVREQAPALRAIADDAREKVSVRIAAVHALGRLCDPEAVELLTLFARRSADPYSPEAASGLGAAAVSALGRIHPKDLKSRLDPLLTAEGVAASVRAAAQAALATTDRCGR